MSCFLISILILILFSHGGFLFWIFLVQFFCPVFLVQFFWSSFFGPVFLSSFFGPVFVQSLFFRFLFLTWPVFFVLQRWRDRGDRPLRTPTQSQPHRAESPTRSRGNQQKTVHCAPRGSPHQGWGGTGLRLRRPPARKPGRISLAQRLAISLAFAVMDLIELREACSALLGFFVFFSYSHFKLKPHCFILVLWRAIAQKIFCPSSFLRKFLHFFQNSLSLPLSRSPSLSFCIVSAVL